MTRRALIVIDAQREYFDGRLPIAYPPRDESIVRVRAAIDAAVAAEVPVVLVRHEGPAGAAVFAADSETARNHELVEEVEAVAAKTLTKRFASVFSQSDLAAWLRARAIDTVTLVGYMTNNCVLATAADGQPYGFSVEVLSDATGAINIANAAGQVPAQQVHETLMALLHSNWAAVADTATWGDAVAQGVALPKSNLVASARGE